MQSSNSNNFMILMANIITDFFYFNGTVVLAYYCIIKIMKQGVKRFEKPFSDIIKLVNLNQEKSKFVSDLKTSVGTEKKLDLFQHAFP